MDEPTNLVLMERLNNLIEVNAKEHDEMLQQVKKTNGSVANLKMWKAYLTGAVSILTMIVIPVAFMFLSAWLSKK